MTWRRVKTIKTHRLPTLLLCAEGEHPAYWLVDAVVVIGVVLPVGVAPGLAGAYLEAHLAWSWTAWKTPSRP